MLRRAYPLPLPTSCRESYRRFVQNGLLFASVSDVSPRDDAPDEGGFESYAKRLERKNRAKTTAGSAFEDHLRPERHSRVHSAEGNVLAVDLLRKHKAMRRDARRLRFLKTALPQKRQRLNAFKPRPFGHCDPAANRIVQTVVHQLRKQREEGPERLAIQETQLLRVEPEEDESIGSLEDLEIRRGTPRSPRPTRLKNPLDMPFSRPDVRSFHDHRPKTMSHIDLHFAEWFVGITEAQLAFYKARNGRPYFALHHTDGQFFRKLRSHLHFGHVDDIRQMWYVKDDKNLQKLMHLLNGNLYLERSRAAFRDWVTDYCALGLWQGEPLEIKDECEWRPQLNNKWLMGWIDSSYGLFAGRIVEDEAFPFFRVQLKFWLLSQDLDLLKHVKEIFGGGEITKDGDWFQWVLKQRKAHEYLDRYCRMFRPYSQKNISIVRYSRLMQYPFAKVKTQKAWKKLQRLVDNLNMFERKNAIAMPGHPYNLRYKENAEFQAMLAREGASIPQVKAFQVRREKKDFPHWTPAESLALVEEVD